MAAELHAAQDRATAELHAARNQSTHGVEAAVTAARTEHQTIVANLHTAHSQQLQVHTLRAVNSRARVELHDFRDRSISASVYECVYVCEV